MESYRLTVKAEEDLSEIYSFGILNFGFDQGNKYLIGLEGLFRQLSKVPFLGRDASDLYPGLRMHVYKSHLIFYLVDESNILIVRILHHSRDYKLLF
jgi:toxin ParE1/3/4